MVGPWLNNVWKFACLILREYPLYIFGTRIWSLLREPNNHTAEKAGEWRKLAAAVVQTYGHRYQRAADYLTQLANNELWRDAPLKPLPWHQRVLPGPALAAPRYIMHDSILAALAPAVPLRAVWQGNRNQWARNRPGGKCLGFHWFPQSWLFFPSICKVGWLGPAFLVVPIINAINLKRIDFSM